ncbi:unnamed protein product [Clonostachys byssicola]|uniref:NAD(P)-binding domain-containing protein n=1 Tax=Clonostachys byssicola TaxID=160290 RepID=A0A9N9UMX0_9HYPO|nr:unnamed protein product [Clonostachys byssicola]
MKIVAVAGGTGKLGLTIAEILQENPEYSVIVLSRKAQDLPNSALKVVGVDYSKPQELQDVLESYEVNTLISALQVNSPESGAAEIALVHAANACSTTRRFISSDWSMPINDPVALLTLSTSKYYLPYLPIRHQTIETLRSTDLEFTTVYNGTIIDQVGTPHIRSHMGVYGIHIDMANRAAAIPGSGEDVVSFTYSFDIARFVEAALGLEKWETEMYCYSDNVTHNEILRIAEETVGCKFNVAYDPIEKLERGEMTELPIHQASYKRFPKPALQRRFSLFGLYHVYGICYVPHEKSLNKIFPHIKTHTVAELMAPWKNV